MTHKIFLTVLSMLFISVLFIFQPCLTAKENLPGPDKSSFFSSPKRPAPSFDHTRHENALSAKGCGICHHVPDKNLNKLVYSEGEEAACSQCHLKEASDKLPALREAGHKSCTQCHRALKKNHQPAGPTTCGECHRNQ